MSQKVVSRNSTIDVLRLVAAFLVVFIHSGIHGLPGKTGTIGVFLLAFARLAVPFFFVVSGYFLYSSDYAKQQGRASKSIRKLLILFLLSSLLYFVFYGWYFGSYTYTFDLMSPVSIFNMVALNHPVYNEALWFILALIGATTIHWLNAKYIKKDGLIIVIAVVCYVMGLLIAGNYSSVSGLNLETMYYRNFLCEAILFTMIGYLLHKHQPWIESIRTTRIILYAMLFTALYIVEYYAISRHVESPGDTYLLTPFVIALIFALCIQLPNLLRNSPVPEMGARLSLYVYILHILVLGILGIWFTRLGLDMHNPRIAALNLIAAFTLSLFIGFLYYSLKTYTLRRISASPLFNRAAKTTSPNKRTGHDKKP